MELSKEIFAKYTDAATLEKIRNYGTLSAMWRHCSHEYASDIAIVYDEKEYAFSQLDNDAAHYRAVLSTCVHTDLRLLDLVRKSERHLA